MDAATLAGARAGRRRFRTTVLVFAVANVAAWFAYHHFYGAGAQRLLRVDRFAPGDRAVVDARPVLEWQFNLDVAPDSVGSGAPGTIQPPIPGKWQWRGRRNLIFTPQQDLPKATPFTVTIPADRLRTPDGFRLSGPFVANIGTAPLRVVGVRQGGFQDDRRYVLEIEFDDAVIPADVASKLSLKGPDDKPLGFKLHGEGVGKFVRVLTDSVGATDSAAGQMVNVAVRLDRGLAGGAGPLGLNQPYEQKLSLGSTLTATSVTAQADARGRAEISLQFNGAIDLALLRSVVSVEPPVPYVINSNYRGVTLEGDFKPANRYAVKIAPAPKGADARLYPRADVLSVFVPDRAPAAYFEHDSGYLGAQGNRTLLAHAVNLPAVRLRVWRVYDTNLIEWRNSGGRSRWQGDPRGYAKPIASRVVPLKTDKNVVQDLRISLDDFIPAGTTADGVFRVSIAAANTRDAQSEDEDGDGRNGDYESGSSIVTLSDIALTAKREEGGLTVWATSLSTARTLQHVRVRVFSNKNQLLGEGLTNADGLVTISGMKPAEGESAAVLLADRLDAPTTRPSEAIEGVQEGDIAAPANDQHAKLGLTWMDLRGGGSWDMADADIAGRAYARTGQEAFVYTDRGAYRPGETVHLRAIVRRADGGPQQAMPVRWLIRRPDLREWKQQVTTTDADGSASLDLALPDDLTTGRWTAQIGLPGEATAVSTFGSRTFLVEEFMPNRLKVGLGFAGKGVDASHQRATISNEALRAVVQADYLFGRQAAGLQTKLTARLDRSWFQPAGWADWTFGDSSRIIESDKVNGAGTIETTKSDDGLDLSNHALNENGHGEWPLQLNRLPKPRSTTRPSESARYMGPWQLAVEASVQEVGGRSVSAADSIQVDALPWYIGVHRQTNGHALPGSPNIVEMSLVTPSGKVAIAEDALEVTLFRESWNNLMTFREGRYRYQSHRVLEPVADAAPREVRVRDGRGSLAVTPPASGAYVLRIYDPRRGGMTTVSFYASNGAGWEDNVSREHPEKVEVIVLSPDDPAHTAAATQPAPARAQSPQSPTFKIGQTARVLIRSPFAGRLLFTVETDRVISTRVIEMSGSTIELPVEITQSLRPNAYVSASVIRAIDPQAKWRTHRAHGTARLTVDPADRRLAVEIVTPPEARPLSTLDLALRVTDAAGQPMPNAPVTVAAVDEGILQLTSFRTPDPLGFFYANRALGVESSDIFGQLMPEVARPENISAIGGDKGAGGTPRYRSPVTARRVRSVALFEVLRTDERGIATTHVSIPEFAGKLRVMAIAHAGPQYGAAERPLFVRAPLLVQSTFPRFAAPADQFVVPITVFNNGKTDLQVTLTAELLATPGSAAAPLAFAATPEAKLTLGAVTIKAAGQHVISLPCVATDRVGVARIRLVASAGAESSSETTELPIRPASPFISSGGFAVVSPAAAEILDLKNEFVAGTEQTSIALTPMPSLQLPQAIDYLERYPYGCAEQTISTTFALLYLDEIGRTIAPGLFEKQRVADKVQAGILRLLGMQTADGGLAMWPGSRESWPWASIYAAHFLAEARAAGHAVPEDFQKRLLAYVRSLLDRAGDDGNLLEGQAYACYVLALSGKPDRAFMSRLGDLTRPRPDGTEETAIRAQARLHLSLAWLAAGRRDLAAEYLPATLPGVRLKRQGGGNVGSPIRDRAMILNTLLTVRPEDPAIPAMAAQLAEAKWQSTQEIAFAAMAIGKYLRQVKSHEPYERAELLLDGAPVTSGVGAIAWTVKPLQQNFLAKITGPPSARGYLTWTRTGVPRAIPPNHDEGLKVRRRYLDERGKPLQSNQVLSGDLVMVELTVESPAAQRNLVIEDLLPAGLEIENSRLETTASLAADTTKRHSRDLREELQDLRTDVRDDRMVLFGHLSANGLARHVYTARAVVPGAFIVPPVRAESMYDPGTSSLWGPGGTLEVKRAETRTIVGVPSGE